MTVLAFTHLLARWKSLLSAELKARAVRQVEYRRLNPGRQSVYDFRYRQANLERIAARKERYRQANLERIAAKNAKWRKANLKHTQEYLKARRFADPAFKLLTNLRNRLNGALFGVGAKSARTVDLLGCSVEQLRAHLEKQFTPGMTWHNHGKQGWHIDHIKPCASFDLSQPDQQRVCFHFSNLQPLWAVDNLRKGDKLPEQNEN